MNSKSTWIWVLTAAALFAFIFLFNRYLRPPAAGPARVLPGLKASAITSISVRPASELEICAQRTNDTWELTRPVVYPASPAAVEGLLAALEGLAPAKHLTANEIGRGPGAYEQYGFEVPQFRVFLEEGGLHTDILIGHKTAPGDQVFVEVAGREDVYVVDAGLLRLIPVTPNDWRDPAFINLHRLAFDHLTVSNAARVIELQRDPTNRLWRIARPMQVRADSDGIAAALQQLQDLSVARYVSDDAKADLDKFGLQPAVFELAFASGTNPVATLEFGNSPTNEPGLVYARRSAINSVVSVPSAPLALWRAPKLDNFRDRHLLTIERPVDQIEVRGAEDFAVQRLSSNTWRFAAQDWPVDSGLVDEFLKLLASVQITRFWEAATVTDLRTNGLDPPARQILLLSAATRAAGLPGTVTNALVSFGTNRDDYVFAKRADEDSVYAIALADFEKLPAAAWQLRERRLWNFTGDEVARVTVRQDGKVRDMVHPGTNSWSLAPGSQGIINDFALEEAAQAFGELQAVIWVQHGGQDLAHYGFQTNGYSLAFELRNGETRRVELGGQAPSQCPYAAVTLDGQTWVFEFPLGLFRQYVLPYLTIPPDVH